MSTYQNMCIDRHTIREILVKIQYFRHEYLSIMYDIIVILFSDIGQCFPPVQTKSLENQKNQAKDKLRYYTLLLVNISDLYIS